MLCPYRLEHVSELKSSALIGASLLACLHCKINYNTNTYSIVDFCHQRFAIHQVSGVDEKDITKVLERILNKETYEKNSIPLKDGRYSVHPCVNMVFTIISIGNFHSHIFSLTQIFAHPLK